MSHGCDNSPEHSTVLIEYPLTHPFHYDGVSEIRCTMELCGRRVGRWCGNKLEDHEVEPPHCSGGTHPAYKAL